MLYNMIVLNFFLLNQKYTFDIKKKHIDEIYLKKQ